VKTKRYEIKIKIKYYKNIIEEAFISRPCTSMYTDGSSWGQKEFKILLANDKIIVNISKELLYSAKTSHNKAVKVRRLSAARGSAKRYVLWLFSLSFFY